MNNFQNIPDHLFEKIVLFNSHPVADLVKNLSYSNTTNTTNYRTKQHTDVLSIEEGQTHIIIDVLSRTTERTETDVMAERSLN